MNIHATNHALLEALQTVVDLPANLVSLKLEMGVDHVPTLELAYQVDVAGSPSETRARLSFPVGAVVHRRYKLIEF